MEGPVPLGLLRNSFGLAPDSVHTLLMDIHRQERSKQPRSLSKSCLRAGGKLDCHLFLVSCQFLYHFGRKILKVTQNLASRAYPWCRALLKQLFWFKRSCKMRNEERMVCALASGKSIFPMLFSQNSASTTGCGHGNSGFEHEDSPGFVQLCPSILAEDLSVDLWWKR